MPTDLPTADPDRFQEAIRAWRRRAPISDADLADLTDEEIEHAFKVAGVSEARVVQEVFDAIDSAIEDGTTLEDFKADIGDLLTEAWGAEDAPRLEAIFRTNVIGSYSEGRDEILDDPAVREARPYKQFRGTGDNRECEICEPIDGVVRPADDPFWDTHRLPLHIADRCEIVALTADEAADEGITEEIPEHEPPQPGFGTRADYEPDLSSFDPEIRSALRDRLK